ncbi:MAG: ComEC/Rec2 family competence protein [bacterium]|nr:ComEC/Rec2 family competence protein [bacterium]
MNLSPNTQKIIFLLLLVTLSIRLLTFNFNTLPPQHLTINTFNRFPNSFYTASAKDNFNLSFSYKGKIHPQSTISYSSYEYNEMYKSYTLKNVKVINNNPTGFSKLKENLYYLKTSLLTRLNTILKGKSYQLSAGMLFGEKTALSKDFKEDLVKVGLIHIVVVSGFNISLVGLLILNTFKRFGVMAYIISFLGIVLYSVLVGLEPPVLRALIMGSIVLIARAKGEESNQIYLLFIAGFIMLFINPIIIKSLSFQLSFMATLGVLTFTPIFDSIFPKYLSDLSASISAQIMVLPILALNFGQVSIVSPIANLLTLWTVPIITVVSGILLLISYFSLALAVFLSFLVTIPSLVIEKTTDILSGVNFASVDVTIDERKVIVTYLCIFACYLYYIFYLSRQ